MASSTTTDCRVLVEVVATPGESVSDLILVILRVVTLTPPKSVLDEGLDLIYI